MDAKHDKLSYGGDCVILRDVVRRSNNQNAIE